MAYTKHTWSAGEPITAEKINAIEQGVEDIHNNTYTQQQINNMLSPIETNVTNAQSTANEAKSIANTARTNAVAGQTALSEIQGALVRTDESGSPIEPFDHLKEKFDDTTGKITQISANVTSLSNNLSQVVTEIQGARSTLKFHGGNEEATNLREKIDDMDYQISINQGSIRTVLTAYNNSTTDIDGVIHNSLAERLDVMENNTKNIADEVEEARDTYDDLDARFDADETAIQNLETNKIPYSDIVTDLITNNDNKPLAASQGRELKQTIGGAYNSTNTVATGITNAEQNAKNYTDSKLGSGFDTTNTVAARFDAIDNASTGALAGLDVRISANTNAINTLNGSGNGSVQKTVNDRIAEVIADAPEAFDTLQEIAEWIGENSDDALTMQQNISNNANAIDNLDERLDAIDGGNLLTGTALATRVDTLEDNIGSGFDSTNTVSKAITDINTALATKANSSDLSNKADASAVSALSETVSTLSGKVTTLENTDTTYTQVIHSATYDNNGKPQISNPSENVDYLIKGENPDTKYYYWKYIKTSSNPDVYSWELISGAGGNGSGNSNSEEYASYNLFIAAEKELNKDYYVLQEDGFYHHYRYLAIGENDDPIEIGAVINEDNIKQYRLQGYTDSETNKNYIDLYEFAYGTDTSATSEGARVSRIEIIGGGGGGVYNTKQITRITPRSRKWPIGSEEKIYLRFFYTNGTANESDKFIITQSNATMTTTAIIGGGDEMIISGDPANASNTWPTKQVEIDGEIITVPKEQAECETGFYQFDITDYCKTLGKQTFVLTITDPDDASVYTTMTWEVTLINLIIESNFTENSIVPLGQAINFTYIPSGDINKVAHFYLDNVEIDTQTLSARIADEQTYTIAGKDVEGTYQLRVYLSASDNGNDIYSEPIYRDLIWRNSNSNTLILSSPYRNRTIEVQQYSALEIPYTIAGNSNSYTVKYYVNDFESSYNEVLLNNTNHGTWVYRPLTKGTQNLRIQVENTHIDITLNVIENVVDIAPYTNNLVLNFDPTGLSNNSNSAKNWTNGTYHLTTSNNFDWFNGGYGTDATGDYFLIKSGTRAYFDYKMFEQELESVETQDNTTIDIPTSKVYRTGQEMKIIFKTSAVRAIDAVWFTNTGKFDTEVDTEVGIQLSAHEGWLKTDSASDEAVGTGDEQVAATNTYLYFPYSEEDRIELDININKEATDNAFAMSYEDGVPSKAYAYTHSQKLYHISGNESIITIGSDDCDVYLYKLKIYNSDLTPAQVLRNFIADGKTVDESIERYQRNCIYYDAEHDVYSPYATSGFELNPEALASKIPNVKVLMLDTPSFTLNKKSFIKDSTLRCIHAPGGTLYKSRGAADNWFFEKGYHAGQGTTSDKYGDSGRNIDFLFNCDGTHKPSDKVKNPDPNYISQVTTGYGTDQAATSIVTDWKGTSGKITLTDTSVPNNFFNFKVNIASSENVNNALLQKRYNDFLPYISPASAKQIAKYGTAYQRDYGLDLSKLKIKNDMEFVPAVLFVRENGTGETVHSEFGDTNWHFYALGNLGDSKKTDYTRAYDPDDFNEFTIEISDNNTNNSQFQTGVYMLNGTPTNELFEAVQDVDDEGALIEDSYTAQGRSGAIATTDYIYPLDTPALKALWNEVDAQTGELKNKSHWALVNEPYDGDHSFEMRYACCGDYRDGKKVNDTTGNASAQLNKNSKVWQAFYSWVVTASNEEFVRDLDQWCVRSAVEFWYAFTHYYTMMDNRAKNTFWHFAKTGVHHQVTNPIKDMLHVYDEETSEGSGIFTRTADTDIVAGKTYWTEYAFDLWDYDNDTALGIDNNGELIFPYGKEDKDYRLGDDPASGYVFNGAGSVFWRRLRDLCTSEISSIFNTVNEQFFSAENLIKQFDDFQECYPEALWQVDIQRKYIRPFTNDKGKTLPNGSTEFLTRQSKRFLESMMQGRKKYQRRQWIKDQYYYFGSKYKLNNITEDFFYLDCYTGPDDALIAELIANGQEQEAAKYVGSNWDLTITPYQDMYINTSFGETAKSPVRAKAGEPIEMTCPFTSMNNTRIYIYGASRLKALAGKPIKDGQGNITGAEGLASLYIGVNSIEKTDKLQHLYLGTDKTTYRNANLTKLTLNENSPILETLDIRNCGSLAGELKLGGCNNLTTLEAEGTNITLVTLPASSQITILHLPSTITSLSLSAARKLTNFYMKNKSTQLEDYSNLRSLIVDNSDEHSTVNWMNIAKSCITNLNYLYLLNLKTSSIININELEAFKVRNEAVGNINLSGILNVTGNWSIVEKNEYQTYWSGLTLNTTGTEVKKYLVEFKYDPDTALAKGLVGDAATIHKYYVTETNATIGGQLTVIRDGQPVALDPITLGDVQLSALSRPSTDQYTYTFGEYDNGEYIALSGWKYNGYTPDMNTSFKTNIILYTDYSSSDRLYKFRWFMNEEDTTPVAESGNIKYGEGTTVIAPTVATLRANDVPTYTTSNGQYKIFKGWSHLPLNITPANQNIYAQWETYDIGTDFSSGINLSELTAGKLLEVCETQSALNLISQNDRMEIQLGYDGADPSGGQLVTSNYTGSASYIRIHKTSIKPVFNTVTPLTTDSAFTLALDFKYDINTSDLSNTNNGESVLVSCYSNDNDTITGFKVFYDMTNNYSRVSFGDTTGTNNMAAHSIIIGGANVAHNRNIIVLRHPANSPKLYVYYGTAYNGLAENITEGTIELNSFIPCTRPLVFGGCTYSNGNYIDDLNALGITTGRGTIYWAKLWNKDLGSGECRQLANWCHEKMIFGVVQRTGSGNVLNIPQTDTAPRLYLSSLCTSTMGEYTLSSGSGDTIGWINSPIRTMINKRLFNALPIQFQAIAFPTTIVSRHAIMDTSNPYSQPYVIDNSRNDIIRGDYISIAAYPMISNGAGTAYQPEANGRLPWSSASNATVYNYDGTQSPPFIVTTTSERYPTARFKGVPISYSPTVYKINISENVNIYNTITANYTLNAGDIWESGEDMLYIYATRAQVNAGAPIVQASSGSIYQCAEGGWVPATAWWTRSFTNGLYSNPNYIYVGTNGQINTNANGELSCNIDYSIGF